MIPTRRRTVSASFLCNVEIAREIDDEGEVGPITVKGSNNLTRHLQLETSHGLTSIINAEYEDTGFALNIDEQIVVSVNSDNITEYDTVEEAVDAFVSAISADLERKLKTAFIIDEYR